MPTPSRQPVRLALAALLLALAGCGGPRAVSLADLTWDTDRYVGSDVTTSGVVLEFTEADGALGRHFVLQDADANRVQLLPDDAAEPHVGALVEVTGAFEFDPSRGRVLHVETIGPAGRGGQPSAAQNR